MKNMPTASTTATITAKKMATSIESLPVFLAMNSSALLGFSSSAISGSYSLAASVMVFTPITSISTKFTTPRMIGQPSALYLSRNKVVFCFWVTMFPGSCRTAMAVYFSERIITPSSTPCPPIFVLFIYYSFFPMPLLWFSIVIISHAAGIYKVFLLFSSRLHSTKTDRMKQGHAVCGFAKIRLSCSVHSVSLFKAVYTAACIYQLLPTRKERMTFGANIYFHIRLYRTSCKCFTTGALYCAFLIVGMNTFFHCLSPLFPAGDAPADTIAYLFATL